MITPDPTVSVHHHPERFHALDATRAFALLLGVVFHAAWFYTPQPTETPVKDVAANHFLGWLFFAIHTFRMQLFFLIAGFFARLVIEKRGLAAFAKNRFRRIVIPFVVGWFILYPLLIMTWIWGRNVSGQHLEAVPPHLVTIYLLISGMAFKEKAAGGAFSLLHLWFLAYLIYCSAITAAGRIALQRFPQVHTRLQTGADRFLSFITRPVVGVTALTLIQAPLLLSMTGWGGIDTPGNSRLPEPAVLIAYLLWFVIGWILHRQAHQLDRLFAAWKFQIPAGLAASVGLYLAFAAPGVAEKPASPGLLTSSDVTDWPALRRRFLDEPEFSPAANPLQRAWFLFSPGAKGCFRNKESLTPDETTGLVALLNKTLLDPELLTREIAPDTEPPGLLAMKSSPAAVAANRAALDAVWAGIRPAGENLHDRAKPYKPFYATAYSLATVLLVFGCLGAFQSLCQNHSSAWRYVADSSYWIYLVHLPLLPATEILMFRWDASASIKFPLLCGFNLILLFTSYHFLVRSSFIGRTLNGRAYPFQLPWQSRSQS